MNSLREKITTAISVHLPFTVRLFGQKSRQAGIALMMAMFCLMLIFWLAMEVSFESTVEYAVNSNSMSRLKAYYAARSGIEISLLRIKIYSQIQQQIGSNKSIPASIKSVVDLIWQFPFSWPPMIPKEMNAIDKDDLQEKVKLSKMEASFATTIVDEGSRIDLGDLDSPSSSLKEAAKNRLLAIFNNKIENDDQWRSQHSNFRPEELVNNIIDWVDKDTVSLNGGSESQLYPNLPDGVRLPPNRIFRTVEELRLVHGMTDEFYEMLAKNVTVYGMRAINPNVADGAILKSIDSSITDKVVEEVMKRRSSANNGGPFTSAQDFWDFLNASGARVPKNIMDGLPITTDGVYNFRIKSVGMMGNVTREIEAIVFDLKKSAAQVSQAVQKNNPNPNDNGKGGGSAGGNPPPGGATPGNNQPGKGPPRIVYWSEK